MESDWEAARLLTMQAAWMADNRKPNSLQASMAKAKAGRTGTDIALRCVALAGAVGYGEGELLEKWARDVKILDIFEGTQQIQLLVVARLLLGKTSAELKSQRSLAHQSPGAVDTENAAPNGSASTAWRFGMLSNGGTTTLPPSSGARAASSSASVTQKSTLHRAGCRRPAP